MSVRTRVLFVIPCVLLFGITANGSDCQSSKDCQLQEFCDKGSCHCSEGFVRHLERCFPLKTHGEECYHDVQCENPRMKCSSEESDFIQKKFCFCDIYSLWNSTTNECLEITNITQIAGHFREVYNVSGMLERSAQKVFLGIVIAGLVFVSILLSFIGICSIYGCCKKGKQGRYGEDAPTNDQINEVAVIGLPDGTYEAMETDFSGMGDF